jgi:thioredoxin-related protein
MKTKILTLIVTPVTIATVAAAATVFSASHRASRTVESPPAASTSSAAVVQAKAKWHTDFAEARRLAQAQGEPMLLDFTGSDWCGWCIKLDREIFATPEFNDYAAKHLVLVKVDFPQRRELPADEREQNERLAAQYGVQGFPTLVVLGPGGHLLDTFGYMRGGPGPFLAKLAEVTRRKR